MSFTRVAAALLFIFSLLGARDAAAQMRGRQQRFGDNQGRIFYRGPLRLTLGGGVAIYTGDLANSLADKFPGLSVSGGLLYRLRPHFQVGTEASYFRVGSRDQLPERGLAFQGDNALGTVFVRYEPIQDHSAYAGIQSDPPIVQPFLKAGAGLLLYNPKTYYGTARPGAGTSYLEPERNDYPALAAVLPLGAGLSVRAGNQFRVTLEGTYYFTSTDHLDDVSARGNSKLNDGFGTAELKLEYRIWR